MAGGGGGDGAGGEGWGKWGFWGASKDRGGRGKSEGAAIYWGEEGAAPGTAQCEMGGRDSISRRCVCVGGVFLKRKKQRELFSSPRQGCVDAPPSCSWSLQFLVGALDFLEAGEEGRRLARGKEHPLFLE
jgi:hypothetical protein